MILERATEAVFRPRFVLLLPVCRGTSLKLRLDQDIHTVLSTFYLTALGKLMVLYVNFTVPGPVAKG